MDYGSELFAQRQQAEKETRAAKYKLAWSNYQGDMRPTLATKPGQANDNVAINYARYIVDKGAAFLMGKEVNWQLEEGDETPAEEALRTIWQRNRKMTFLLKLAQMGAIYGHVFVKIIPDYYGRGIARMAQVDAEYVDVSWRGDDIETPWRYLISWVEAGSDGRALDKQQEIVLGEDKRWRVYNRVRRSGGTWQPDLDNPDIDPWQYTWAPIIDCQNIPCAGVYYGLSDLEDPAIMDTLNYVASKINRILRYHSHPRTWGRGFSANQSEVGADEMLIIQAQTGELHNLEMQSDLASSLAYYDRLQTAILRLARVPDLTPQNMSLGASSGFALRLLHGDLLEKTSAKQRTYGDMLVELNRRLLEAAGYGEDNYVTIAWPDPLPMNEQEKLVKDGFELDRGIAAKSTIQTQRGYNPEDENDKIAAEATAEDVRTGNVGALIVKQFAQGQGV